MINRFKNLRILLLVVAILLVLAALFYLPF